MTQPLTLAERRDRLREAIDLAGKQLAEHQASDGDHVGNLLKELSRDVEALEAGETTREDAGAHDHAESRLQALLAELEAGRGHR